jgi:hypothetical protein
MIRLAKISTSWYNIAIMNESAFPSEAERLANLRSQTATLLAKTAHIEDVLDVSIMQAETLLADTQAAANRQKPQATA